MRIRKVAAAGVVLVAMPHIPSEAVVDQLARRRCCPDGRFIGSDWGDRTAFIRPQDHYHPIPVEWSC